MNLPKPHLSFSQIILWLTSKESYRKKYYPAITPEYASSIYMEFGNIVTLAMENKEDWVKFIPCFDTFEHNPNNNPETKTIDVDGVPILAYIDNIDLEKVKFREQKTGMTPWNETKVNKHLQLDIYSLLLQIEFGRVTDECELVWVQTEKKFKSVMMGDIELLGDTFDLVLTGKYEVIPRIITQADRDACRALIVKVGREIEEDYAAMKHLY